MLWLVPIEVEEIKVKYNIFENGGNLEGRVSINGLTMTGKLKLQREATEPNEAVNKDFVDNAATNLDASKIISGTMPVERFPGLNGDVVSTAGSGVLTLKNTGVTPGSYTKVVVNGSGLVTSGSGLTESDIPGFGWEKITSGKPTTLAGYGITNAVNRNDGTVNGNITLTANPVAGDDVVTKGYADAALAGRVGFAVGDIVAYVGNTTPTGFLRCNGGEVSKTTYAALYSVAGDLFSYDTQPGSGKPWRQQYAFNTEQSADITGWTTGPNLPGALHSSQVIVTKSRVYLLGGSTFGNRLSTVYTAPINEDGTIGTWTTGPTLPGVLVDSQAIVTKNRVYLLGGHNDNNFTSIVYTASINSDGMLSTWTTGTSLPVAMRYSQAVITKNRVYLLGGQSLAGYTAIVYTAPIDSEGVIGTWTTSTSLPEPLSGSQAIVTNNRVYLLGGISGGGVATVYTAPINEDGTLGAWTTGPSLPGELYDSQAIVTKNRVYRLGGTNGNTLTTVYTAPINTDGTLGTWTTGTSLPGVLSHSQVIVTKNRVYMLGGHIGSGPTSTVYTAPFLGGSNDYSPYYDGSIVAVTDPNNFRLPDYSSQEHPNSQYIIKT